MNMTNNICRMCLCGDRRMLAISNTVLQEIWEKLTNAKFNTNDGKPCLVCYMCYAQLRKCSQLRKRALKAEELLTSFYSNGLKQSQETISLIAGLTNDLDSMCFNKELYQFECKQSVTNTVEEFKKENDEGNEELIADDNDIIIKEEEETPARKRISNEVPQKAKQINLEETTKDKNDLANSVLVSLPNIKCKAFVRSSSKKSSVYTNVQNFKSKPDTKPIPNCILVDKITPKINTLPKHNDETENMMVQNKTLSSNPCYNDAENEILCAPKSELNSYPPEDIGVQLYVCDVSDYAFSIKANSDNHLKYKHAKEKNFSCHICQFKCVEKSVLNIHLRNHTGEKPYMCDLCDYRCSRKRYLKSHIMYKHIKEKKFSCHICQYKCIEKAMLNKHLSKHTGEKPYICDLCDFRCSRKSYLKKHTKFKHAKEKKFSCHICQYKCIEKNILNIHLSKHTGEKPYICDLCDYRCSRKSYLKSHIMWKHNKEKNFSCHICQFKCVEKSVLNIHLRQHTGEKAYMCD